MIKTGKVIYNLLSTNSGITAKVGTRIYPIVMPENTVLPAIVYERSYINSYNRDGFISTTEIDVTVLTADYSDGIEICTLVDGVLNGYSGSISGSNVVDIQNQVGVETYAEETFLQKITYTITTN